MPDQSTTQAVVVAQSALNPDQGVEDLALFNADGTPYTFAATGTDFAALADRVTALEARPEVATVATAIGTAGKTTTSAEPATNTFVVIKFTNGNSADSATVAFNGGSARAIKLGGTASTGAKLTIAANGVALFFFDGTVLNQVGEYV